MIPNHFFRNRHSSPGQAMVEFALAFPLILLLIFGTIECGRLLFFYSSIYTASREAARYGAAVGTNSVAVGVPRYRDCQGIRNAAKRVGFFAEIADADIAISYDSGPDTSSLGLCEAITDSKVKAGTRVVVTISGVYTPMLPLVNLPSLTTNSVTARTILKDVEIGKKTNGGSGGGTTPGLSINDITVAEGNSGTSDATFTLTLTAPSTKTITVYYSSANGTATSGEDYTTVSGTKTFTPGTTSAMITVPVIGDTADETDETFGILLSSPVNVNLVRSAGVATIMDDDGAAGLNCALLTASETSQGNLKTRITLMNGTGITANVTQFKVKSFDSQVSLTSMVDVSTNHTFWSSSGSPAPVTFSDSSPFEISSVFAPVSVDLSFYSSKTNKNYYPISIVVSYQMADGSTCPSRQFDFSEK